LQRGENPSEVLAALHARIDELNREILPPGVRIETFYDRTWLVDATLRTVGKNLAEGALLVLAVVYLFLRTWRAVLVIGVVIPLSMLTAFIGLRWLGLPANLISLGAIDFGILVDGAIVVLEATLHAIHHEPARNRAQVIARASAGVARSVALALLIIIAALLPIFTLERVEGRIFAPMAYTYAFALIGALLSAALVVPALERVLLGGRIRAEAPRWLETLGELYAALLVRLLPLRRVAGALLVGGMLALGGYAREIGSEFLPELNEGGFYITAVFPSTIALDETKRHVSAMRAAILELPEATDVLSHIGRPEDATQAEGPNNAEFFVNLAPESRWRPGATRRTLEAELRARLETIPGVELNFSQPITDRVFETISGIIGQVVVKIRGEDLAAMTSLAEEVRARLEGVPGVADLALYQAGSVPQLRIELDREALARRGLSVEDVQTTIRVALGSAVATEVWDGERRYGVALRLPDAVRADPEALRRLVVSDPRAGVTLGEVATISLAPGRAAIWREDFTRFVAVKFNVRGRDLGSTVQAAREAVRELEVAPGLQIVWSGEFVNQDRAMRRLALTTPVALAAILGLLFLNFGRLRPTLVIAAFLPLACVGAIAGLRAAGELFSVSSAVGCIALLGQVVLSGVVLCGAIDRAAAESPTAARIRGARAALRPVLLTTALALLGLVPASLSQAMGSETQRPFAIAIVAGLVVTTPIMLVLLPLLYGGQPRHPGGTP
ncbi:MAG TPA: efflux RND transporter permease subunit, partial [Nannocystis sp.]